MTEGTLLSTNIGGRGPFAVTSPEVYDFDYIQVESTLKGISGKSDYIVLSGFGLQGTISLFLYMTNPHSIINVIIPPDKTLIHPWWYAQGINMDRVNLIPIRGNSKIARNRALLKGSSELLAFCEYDEHLMESDPKEGNGNQQPWEAVLTARKMNIPISVSVLRSKEESNRLTRSTFLK